MMIFEHSLILNTYSTLRFFLYVASYHKLNASTHYSLFLSISVKKTFSMYFFPTISIVKTTFHVAFPYIKNIYNANGSCKYHSFSSSKFYF